MPNTVVLYELASAKAPFQPQLALPPVDFRIGIYHPSAVQVLPARGVSYANQGGGHGLSRADRQHYERWRYCGHGGFRLHRRADAQDFVVTGRCAGALGAGASCTLGVVFRPTAAGQRPAYLTVQTSGTASDPNALPLLGTAN